MTTIGLSYSLVKISTKCAPALGICKVLDDDDGHTYHGQLELVERIELDDSPAWSLF